MASGQIARLLCLAGVVLLFGVSGCAKPGSGGGSGGSGGGPGGGGGGSNPNPVNLTGNWQFQVTSSAPTAFNGLSGFVNEQLGSAGDSSTTTASLKVLESSCFSASQVLDLFGFTKDPYSQLTAFPSYAQTLSLSLSSTCSGGVNLCGSYQITGGCGDGQTGQIVGVQYTAINGTYRTSGTGPIGLQAVFAQAAQGNGQGTTQVSGTLTFTGATCLSTATLDPTQSYISGSSLRFVATTNAASGATLSGSASVVPSAASMTLGTITLSGSSCLDAISGTQLAKAT